jgi:hypothetical protein
MRPQTTIEARRRIMGGLVLALLMGGMREGAAQTSIYGIRGLGFPGRVATARERALGSGLLALDPGSPVNPAAVAGFGGITAVIMGETDFRSYSVNGVDAGGLTSTRFPLAQLGGRLGNSRLSFALSFAQYTERSYDLTLADTLELRGQPVAFEERTTSRGGVADVRGALGYRLGPNLWIGAGMHLLTGSAKLTLTRESADTAYRPYRLETEESVGGLGVSAGVIWVPLTPIALGLSVRSDTRAEVTVDSVTVADVDLPVTIVGGVRLAPVPALRWATSVTWRSWSRADADVTGRAFDTWEVGSGLEFGGAESGASRFPIRLGFRYATLPFSPTDFQPREIGISAGFGLVLSAGRGLLDVALERARRTGAGSAETAWQLSWTVTVRP